MGGGGLRGRVKRKCGDREKNVLCELSEYQGNAAKQVEKNTNMKKNKGTKIYNLRLILARW